MKLKTAQENLNQYIYNSACNPENIAESIKCANNVDELIKYLQFEVDNITELKKISQSTTVKKMVRKLFRYYSYDGESVAGALGMKMEEVEKLVK